MNAANALSSPRAVLAGFLLLLCAVFGAAYAAGSLAGPVAPGLHPSSTPGEDGPKPRHGQGQGHGNGHGHAGGGR